MPPGSTMKMWSQAAEPQAATRAGKARAARPKPGRPAPQGGWWRRNWLRVLKWTALSGLVCVAIGISTIAIVFWTYGRDPNLPTVDKLREYLDHPKQITKVLDRNDREIGELGSERRTFVTFDKIPPIVIDAFVAAEDNGFWTHGGVDYWGMARAFVANLRAGHTKEGASTITQQVVKNFLLGNQRTFKRKIQEIILARRLEHALSKQEIMTLYLNQIDFGHSTYGVQEAARLYFGKDVAQVNAGEAAVLASLPKEPEALYRALHGGKNPERAKDRQVYVLNQMVKIGKLSQADAQKFIDAPIQVIAHPFAKHDVAPEWVDIAKQQLIDVEGKDALGSLGGNVRTTLDPAYQALAQKALQDGLRAVDKRHKLGRPIRSVKPDKIEAEIVHLAKKLPAGGPQPKEVYEAVVTAVHDDDHELEVDLGKFPGTITLGGPEDDRYNPPDDDGPKRSGPDSLRPAGTVKSLSERFKVGDVVWAMVPQPAAPKTADEEDDQAAVQPKHGKQRVIFAPGPEGAVVIMEVKSRKVRAIVGGYSAHAAGFDRATMAMRQPGSAFKPIVYATAFEQAAARKCHANDPSQTQVCATPGTIVNDAPESKDSWVPKNFETGEYEGQVRLRSALAKSINTVSVHLVLDIGADKVVEMAHRLGIPENLPAEPSIALGSTEVKPVELVDAYATLGDGGQYIPPRFIEAIDGKPLPDPKPVQAIAPELAYVMTDTMRAVTTEGTAAAVGEKLKGIPIAGKTGTSNEARNCWFIGMTPDYVIGVWVGYDDNRPMPGEQGARVAAPVFIDIAKQLKLPAKQFERPPHVVEAVIDRQTGLLAPDGAPKNTTLTEVFVEGTQPVDVAPKPGEVTEGGSVTGDP
ncbi:MAG: penicillin-binding protein 1A [Acidobacteriota bacterium]